MKHLIFILLISVFVIAGCKQAEVLHVFDGEKLDWQGRIGENKDGSKEIYWSGSSVKINFEGTSAGVILKDENHENYFNVIVDGDSIIILRPDTVKKLYTLVEGLTKGKHQIELYKRTEWIRGKTNFYGFEVDGEVLEPDSGNGRRIEFYGNSITCGYGNEDYSGNDSPDSIFTNHYMGYAAMTARHFKAKMSSISHSGIGIMVSWFPSIIWDDYDQLDPSFGSSKWDFTQQVPQVVVINLFQNDSWLVNKPNHPSFKKYFGDKAPNEHEIIEAYKEFVTAIRSKYPKAEIICALGAMDITREGSPWPGYVQQAVNELNDSRMHTFFMPYKNTPGHPKVEEHRVMADSLIAFIEQNIEW